MESKKINQLATELTPALSDLTIIGDPTTGISKKITLSQMASLFTGTVEEYPSLASFPLVGVADTIYIALDTNVLYRWNTGTSAYVELSPNIINSLVFSDANGFDGNISLVGSVATLTITTALTSGSVPFIGASGALTQDNANLFFDDTNNRLGINTNSPTTALDVFGSGIIGRVNGTSTNNAFLGFASAGSNKWSIGNVQSDHRFRIFSETNTSELVSVLQTGEFGIGIANPTTKFHIDGAATALIANLDANISVAKSISFRSDNSNRINLEVSGTESGSNAGANFFLRTYTDLGSLIETPFSIVRSTGVTTIKSLTLTNALSVANGGTGATSFTSGSILFSNGTSVAQDNAKFFWDDTNNRLGIGTSSPTRILHLSDSGSNCAIRIDNTVSGRPFLFTYDDSQNATFINSSDSGIIAFNTGTGTSTTKFSIAASGAATFTNSITTGAFIKSSVTSGGSVITAESTATSGEGQFIVLGKNSSGTIRSGAFKYDNADVLRIGTSSNIGFQFETNDVIRMFISNGGKILIGTTSSANTGLGTKTKQYIVGDGSTNAAASHGSMFVAAGTGTADTGISVNQGTAGMTMILIASINTSTGTSTDSAVYIVRFYFSGNNTPTATYIGGSSNFVTFSTSGSNTLNLTGSSSGNKSYAWFVNKFGDV
jgi:hypothetical protein